MPCPLPATSTPATYTLSLHDALPIFGRSTMPRPSRFSRKPRNISRRSISQKWLSVILRQATARRHSGDRKSTRLNSSHMSSSYAVFCLKKKMEKLLDERPEHMMFNGYIDALSATRNIDSRDLHSFPTRRSSDLRTLHDAEAQPLFEKAKKYFSPLDFAEVAERYLATSYGAAALWRSEEHTSELQSHVKLVCRLLLEKKNGEAARRAS